jgi:hypothetical protein
MSAAISADAIPAMNNRISDSRKILAPTTMPFAMFRLDGGTQSGRNPNTQCTTRQE